MAKLQFTKAPAAKHYLAWRKEVEMAEVDLAKVDRVDLVDAVLYNQHSSYSTGLKWVESLLVDLAKKSKPVPEEIRMALKEVGRMRKWERWYMKKGWRPGLTWVLPKRMWKKKS